MIIQSGVQQPLDYTAADQDPTLFVAAKVLDVTAGFPGTLVGSLIAMNHTELGIYVAGFTGVAGKQYQIKKACYTDGTFTTPTDRAASVEDIQCLDITGGGGGGTCDMTQINQALNTLNEMIKSLATGNTLAGEIVTDKLEGDLTQTENITGEITDPELI